MPQDNRALDGRPMPGSVFVIPPGSAVGGLTEGRTEGIPLPRTAPRDPSRLTPTGHTTPAPPTSQGFSEECDHIAAREAHIEGWAGPKAGELGIRRLVRLESAGYFAHLLGTLVHSLIGADPLHKAAVREARHWCRSLDLAPAGERLERDAYVQQATRGQLIFLQQYRALALKWHLVNLVASVLSLGVWLPFWGWKAAPVMILVNHSAINGRAFTFPSAVDVVSQLVGDPPRTVPAKETA